MTFFTGFLGALKLVPKWVWILLAAALVWRFALGWHSGQIKEHDRQVIAERDAYWKTQIAAVHAEAVAVRRQAEAVSAQITEKVRTDHESETRAIAADAGALRVRGPGAASVSCRPSDHPGVSVAASGAGRGPAVANAAGSEAVTGAGAVVPWNWLVNRAEQHDALRAETLAWRSWYQQQSTAWEKMRATP